MADFTETKCKFCEAACEHGLTVCDACVDKTNAEAEIHPAVLFIGGPADGKRLRIPSGQHGAMINTTSSERFFYRGERISCSPNIEAFRVFIWEKLSVCDALQMLMDAYGPNTQTTSNCAVNTNETTHTPAEVPLCIQCDHYTRSATGVPMCVRNIKVSRDPVTGNLIPRGQARCSSERRRRFFRKNHHCGPEGRFHTSRSKSKAEAQYDGRVPCLKCGGAHWMHSPCPDGTRIAPELYDKDNGVAL